MAPPWLGGMNTDTFAYDIKLEVADFVVTMILIS